MLENKELAGHLDSLLQRLSVSTHRQKNHFAEVIGISRQQFDVLCIIYEKGLITMGELCKDISSACSTATDLADKLERAGYVERLREKKDRRVVRLNILPKGEKLVKSVIEQRSEKLGAVLEAFDEEEKMKTISFLETLTDRLERQQ
ncbi:MAG: Transcriptional repressor MprA [Candidatus Dichloromethanomonas elyunquensis]|nr:MAG: Transcriptional repressor MprA [Candidatus Dichloromethanomonas elyunquensis]